MKKIFGLMLLFLIAQCSCNSTSNQTTEQKDKRETSSKSNSESNKTESNKTESNNSKESADKNAEKYRNDPQSYSQMVYETTLESIAWGNEFGNPEDFRDLGLKRETITPVNVEKLKTFDDLKPSTIESFIERNRTMEKLKGGYDVHFTLKVVDGNDSYEKLLVRIQNKLKVFGVVGLSKAGFSEDFTQSLIYVEFYGNDKLLQRKYLMITWDIYEAGAHVKATKWFSA